MNSSEPSPSPAPAASSASAHRSPSAQARKFDLISIGAVFAGSLVYGWAYVGMEKLRTMAPDPSAPIWSGYGRWVRLTQLSLLGQGLIGLGILVGVGAAWHHRRRRRE